MKALPRTLTSARPELAERILQAAKPLFAQHGYGGVSIDRIAEAAGISKQNLLYYFPRKLLLYREVLDTYEAPPIDDAVDAELQDFVARRKAATPDQWY